MFTSPDLRRIAVSVAAFGLAAGFPTAVTGGTADARTSQLLSGVSVASDGPPFAGDSARYATVSPNGDSFRDAAVVRFGLRQPARVTLGAYASGEGATAPRLVGRRTVQLAAGSHTLQWQPRQTLTPRTYMVPPQRALRARTWCGSTPSTVEAGAARWAPSGPATPPRTSCEFSGSTRGSPGPATSPARERGWWSRGMCAPLRSSSSGPGRRRIRASAATAAKRCGACRSEQPSRSCGAAPGTTRLHCESGSRTPLPACTSNA